MCVRVCVHVPVLRGRWAGPEHMDKGKRQEGPIRNRNDNGRNEGETQLPNLYQAVRGKCKDTALKSHLLFFFKAQYTSTV